MLVCLFFALLILTLVGVGNVFIVSVLGMLLGLLGLAQREVKVDLWVLLPLVVYNLFSMASSYQTFGNTLEGFASTQMIWPTLYLFMAYLKKNQLLLLRQLCVIWAGVTAVFGIGQFVYGAVLLHSGKRLGGILHNPNGLGIFLVLGWFALLACWENQGSRCNGRTSLPLQYTEPFLLTALTLTLSMGSFAAMAAGIGLFFCQKKKNHSWRETWQYGYFLLAKVSFCFAIGVLLYFTAARTDFPWLCLLLLGYLVIVTIFWQRLQDFFLRYQWMAAIIACSGILIAGIAVAIRPSAIDTFAERLCMIKDGLGYLTINPWLGVGPYQWRHLNLLEGDTYFNTNHIHNVFVHVGVELGWIAMAMLIILTVRCFQKKESAAQFGACVAFLLHSFIDTGFFYLGITSIFLLTVGEPNKGGRELSVWEARIMCGLFTAIFFYHLCVYVNYMWRG